MKRILNLLLIAGALTLLPSLSAKPRQSSAIADQPQATANPQAKTSTTASSNNRHHSRHKKTAHVQKKHKAPAKH